MLNLLRKFRIVRVNYIRNLHLTFKEEQIVIPMTTVPNDEVLMLPQHKNAVVPLQGTYIVHP